MGWTFELSLTICCPSKRFAFYSVIGLESSQGPTPFLLGLFLSSVREGVGEVLGASSVVETLHSDERQQVFFNMLIVYLINSTDAGYHTFIFLIGLPLRWFPSRIGGMEGRGRGKGELSRS